MSDDWGQRRTSFGSAAADYATGRPHYPIESLAWAVPEGSRTVLDLAAGTGILTQDLLARGLDVIAVEPLPEMRALIPSAATIMAGSAEAIPLEDNSVDAVLIGQAWHWFEVPAALAETHRVLRPGGVIAPMWNYIDTSDALSRTVAEIIDDPRGDNAATEPQQPEGWDAYYEPLKRVLIPHVQGYDADRLVAYTVSRSQTIILDDEQRDALTDELRAALPDGAFPVNWFCETWRGTAR